MCSNTSLSSGGGGDNGGYDGDSIYSKKPKKQKIPKRGPGVAELEKILREQEKKNDLDKTKNEGFSLVSPISNSYQPQSPILHSSNSLPKNAPFGPDPHHFSSPMTTLYGKGGSNTSLGGGGGGNGGKSSGSGIVLPEPALLPAMWNSCGASVDVECPRSSPGFPFLRRSSNGPSQVFPSPTLVQRGQYSPPSIVSRKFFFNDFWFL